MKVTPVSLPKKVPGELQAAPWVPGQGRPLPSPQLRGRCSFCPAADPSSLSCPLAGVPHCLSMSPRGSVLAALPWGALPNACLTCAPTPRTGLWPGHHNDLPPTEGVPHIRAGRRLLWLPSPCPHFSAKQDEAPRSLTATWTLTHPPSALSPVAGGSRDSECLWDWPTGSHGVNHGSTICAERGSGGLASAG